MLKKSIGIFHLLLLNQLFISAQTCCTGGTQLLGTYIPDMVNKGELKGHLTFNYNRIGDIILEDKKLDESFLKRDVISNILQLDYGVGKSLSLSVLIPYLHQKETITSGNGFVYTSSGIGDISVWVHIHKTFNDLNMNLSAGIKAPTGSTEESTDGVLVPLSMQLGSGSYDFGLNHRASYYLDRMKKFSLENQIAVKLNSAGKEFTAHPNYKFGNQFQLMSALTYRNVLKKMLLNSFIGFMYQYREKDLFESGFKNENTGGHWYHFIIGQTITLSPKMNISLNTLFPFYRNLNGLQLSTTWQGSISISYIIHQKDEALDSNF